MRGMSDPTKPWDRQIPLWLAAWALLLSLLTGFWAGTLSRPTQDRWHIDKLKIGQVEMLVRVDRQSGKTETLVPNGDWNPTFPDQRAIR